MSHPYAAHRQGKLEHDRVAKIAGAKPSAAMKDEAGLGSIKRGIQSAKVDRMTTAKLGTGAVKRLDKFARGGKVKSKGTNVNIIIGAQDKPPMPLAGASPLPMPPVPPGPAVPSPMAGPGPGLPPMMPHARGGRAYAKGGAVKHERGLSKVKLEGMRNGTQVDHREGKADLGDIRTTKPITYARGGAVPKWLDGGAGSGVGRLEKAEEYGKRR